MCHMSGVESTSIVALPLLQHPNLSFHAYEARADCHMATPFAPGHHHHARNRNHLVDVIHTGFLSTSHQVPSEAQSNDQTTESVWSFSNRTSGRVFRALAIEFQAIGRAAPTKPEAGLGKGRGRGLGGRPRARSVPGVRRAHPPPVFLEEPEQGFRFGTRSLDGVWGVETLFESRWGRHYVQATKANHELGKVKHAHRLHFSASSWWQDGGRNPRLPFEQAQLDDADSSHSWSGRSSKGMLEGWKKVTFHLLKNLFISPPLAESFTTRSIPIFPCGELP